MSDDQIPVILAHGWGGTYAATWHQSELDRRLRAAGRRILALDLPGHGMLPQAHEPEAYARIADLFLAQFAHEPVVDGVGYSLGGKLLLELAARFPVRFRRLVIAGVGANLHRPENGDFIAQALCNPDPRDPYPPALAAVLAFARASGNHPEALSAVIRRPAQPMLPESLAVITASVLLVAGREDGIGADPEAIQTRIPGARLEWIAGADHLALPASAEFQQLALEFLGVSQPLSIVVSKISEVGLHQIRPDLRGTVIEGTNVTLVRWVVAPGNEATPLHAHAEHEQFTILIAGSVETVVGEEILVLRAGDVCRIPRGAEHGRTKVLGDVDAVLIDVFEPRRQDYLVAGVRVR